MAEVFAIHMALEVRLRELCVCVRGCLRVLCFIRSTADAINACS